jgi:Ca2+-binding RTX toxin-like protein
MIQFAFHARGLRGRRGLALLAITALAAAQGVSSAGSAQAAAGSRVYLAPSGGDTALTFQDSKGLVNDVTIRGNTVTDAASRLIAGTGCVNTDPHTVTCAGYFSGLTQIHLGPKNDRIIDYGFERVSITHFIYGDQGDDIIRDLPASGRDYGGPGNDVIDIRGNQGTAFGGPGNDLMDARKGNNEFLHGEDGNDVLFGSSGAFLYGENGDDWLDGINPVMPNGAFICDGGAGTNLIENCPPAS